MNRKRERYLGIYDVDIFLGALDQLHESFSDIGAHKDLQKPNFFMSELLLEKLCNTLGHQLDGFTNIIRSLLYYNLFS